MEFEAYKELVGDYILSLKPTQISNKSLLDIYEQLKGVDEKDLIKIFKLIEYTKQNIFDNNHQKVMTSQMNDELIKDIKELIQANQTNMKMLGYSPLIGYIFNYYVYVKYFKSDVTKFNELFNSLENKLNQVISNRLRESTDRIVKKFYRFNRIRFGKHREILISERRKNNIKKNIEKIYKKKIHKDTFQIIFIKILVETKLLSCKDANGILNKLFSISYYMDLNYLEKEEVKAIVNRPEFPIYLAISTDILLESNT